MTARLFRSCFVLAVIIFSSGCHSDNLASTYPKLEVCRHADGLECASPIDIGALRRGETHLVDIAIRNVGGAVLDIDSIEILRGDVIEIVTWPEEVENFRSESLSLQLIPELGASSATIAIESNDPDNPYYEFDVTFEGVTGDLVLCPAPGMVSQPTGCAEDLTVLLSDLRGADSYYLPVFLRNSGVAAIDLSGATATDDCSVRGEFAIESSLGPGVLEAGADAVIGIRYIPQDRQEDSLHVDVFEAGTDNPSVQLDVVVGFGDNEPPVAVADEVETGATEITTRVGLDVWITGTRSHDPEGDPLSYQWRIVDSPVGSTATLESNNTVSTGFRAATMGQYTVRLEVTDSLGQAGHTDVGIDVGPGYELVVTANWPTAVGDVDLHMVPSGDPVFGETDCYFLQPSVDIGAAGDATDDLMYLGDDQGERGEERIAIDRPAPGHYDIYVNYYMPAADVSAAAVTVRVEGFDSSAQYGSIGGELFNRCDTWLVGSVQWPGGFFTPGTDPATQICFGEEVQ